MRKHLLPCARLALLCASAVVLVAQTNRPTAFAGTWKLDLAHTATTPPNPTAPQPRQITLTVQEQGEHRIVTFVGTNADGSPIRGGFTVPVLGGPGTVDGGGDAYDGITLKYVSPTVHDLIYTKGDKAVATRHVVLSPDQKTMTTTYKGADEQGSPTTRVEVWHKRKAIVPTGQR